MTHIITQSCCNDASCVAVCPVNCIHPTPDEPDYRRAEMLYIDPDSCIDCGACMDVCPVDAIVTDGELTLETEPYAEINAAYYSDQEPGTAGDVGSPAVTVKTPPEAAPLRVAVVGSGPAAFYAAEELLSRRGLYVEVSMFERLPTPWGLVRFGVAPDHPRTKTVTELFQKTARRKGFNFYLNTEVGKHISHEEILAHHDAVIYAVGAPEDRRLGIPGEELPGSHSATDFVAWYNGHPDYVHRTFDLATERAVVVGNGNVALDVARILVSDVATLARTDIADHALEALAASRIKEVVVLGRRGPFQAAFTTPELLALGNLPGIDVTADTAAESGPDGAGMGGAFPASLKSKIIAEYAARERTPGNRLINLSFLRSPVEFFGERSVRGIRISRNRLVDDSHGNVTVEQTGVVEDLECGLVLRSVGYRGRPVPGLPFDSRAGTIPNIDGRVLDPESGQPSKGVYTAGWIKRGPSGVIGTNKLCARDTVTQLLDDHFAGRLQSPSKGQRELDELVEQRQPRRIDLSGWKSIDSHEVSAGILGGRPRVKLVEVDEMLRVAGAENADAVTPIGSASI
ncbi:MAG: FAD-dependent oxidoreductase [Rhodococcus sp. (in: high G+C Gram-positive bacteria)]|uniref:FAD-dependent oxidoreductase n=1 Tax=Rhodococcus sp. TaxID=1831 RepID=UPI003BAEC4A1